MYSTVLYPVSNLLLLTVVCNGEKEWRCDFGHLDIWTFGHFGLIPPPPPRHHILIVALAGHKPTQTSLGTGALTFGT